MDLDTTDCTILSSLQEDGRITNTELADRVGLSPSACLRRVRALEDKGVIDRYVALVNPTAIGKATSVFVEISLSSQEETLLNSFETEVAKHPAVMSCHLMAGNSDYLVRVACRDVEDYENLHRTHFSRLPGIARIRSSFGLRTICDRTKHHLS
jgi:Lrp/AsnC family leucine-responsive transcriptional regulator